MLEKKMENMEIQDKKQEIVEKFRTKGPSTRTALRTFYMLSYIAVTVTAVTHGRQNLPKAYKTVLIGLERVVGDFAVGDFEKRLIFISVFQWESR